jgi:tetratricopeptide (TPR) repeat protein
MLPIMRDRLDLLLEMLSATPEDAFTLFAIAKEYEKREAEQEALRFYERLRAVHPGYVGLYYHLGKLHERLGDLASAVRTYDAGMAVANQAGDQHAWNELSTARLGIADPDDEI